MLCTGAILTCSFGGAPAVFVATPVAGALQLAGSLATGLVGHVAPMANIPPFGLCRAPANPVVIAATAAALGTPTPGACVPATTGPWMPPSGITAANGMPVATVASRCLCAWGGVIAVGRQAAPEADTL